MRVVLYARVSSEKQAEKDLSIASQLKALRKYAAEGGHSVVREFVDEAESARTANRPAFQEMIAWAKQKPKPFDVILVWKLSRFARNREDSIIYKSLLRKRDIQVISINEKFDDSPAGTLLEGLIEVIDEFYSANLGQDTKRGLKENASRGYYNGGPPPIGYKIEKVRVNTAMKNTLVPDEEFSPVVKRIFDMALSGQGAKEVVNILSREGIQANSGRPWTKNHILYILRNEVYNGTLVFGKSERNQDLVRKEHNHPAIVSKHDFDRVQSLLTERSPNNCKPRTLSSPYLLSGLLYCGKCGNAMQGCSAKSGRFHYYACYNVIRKGKTVCDAKLINKERVENAVIERLKCNVLTDENLSELLELTNRELLKSQNATETQVSALGKEIIKQQRKLDNLYRVLETGKIDIEDIAPRIKELRSLIDGYKNQQIALTQKPHTPLEPMTKAQLKAYVEDLGNLLLSGTFTEQKSFIKSFVRKIVVENGRVNILYTYPVTGAEESLGNLEVLGSERKSSSGRARTCNLAVNSRSLYH